MNIFSSKLSSNAYEIKLFMFSTVANHVKIKMDEKKLIKNKLCMKAISAMKIRSRKIDKNG